MQVKPIDSARFRVCLCVAEPEQRNDPTTGAPRLDREGRQQWVVAVAVMTEGGRRSDADVIDVVTSAEPQGITVGLPVKLVDLTASEWNIDGRSGTAWRAASIVPSSRGASASAQGGARGKSGGES